MKDIMHSEKLKITTIMAIAICSLTFGPNMEVRADAKESKASMIARAESAAPADISANATIVDVDGTVLRKGTNDWTCIPGIPLIPGDDHPMCNDATWMAWLKAAADSKPFSTGIIGISYMLQGDALVDNADPAATDPSIGKMWVKEGPHLMMLFPNTSMIASLPRDPYAGGAYVMWDNTPLVHVMVPIEQKSRAGSGK